MSPRRRVQRGFTLVEVLVSILVFAFGVLALVGLQAKLLQASTQNGDRARASMLANEITAQMWMQQSVTLDADTVDAWKTRVAAASSAGLPNGSASVTTSTSGGVTTATVKITWLPTTAAAGAASSAYTTTLVVP